MKSTLQALQAELKALNIRLAEKKSEEKRTAFAAIKQQVDLYGITQDELLRELGFIKPVKKKAPAKYYDPNSGRSWSGRGPQPKWLEGKNLDDYLVNRSPSHDAKPWWPGE